MEYTRYGFAQVVAAFFEMPTADARKLLPPHLQPLEVQHTRSILAITAFEFTESMVGSYNEIVLSIIVPPRVEVGQLLPKAAFFPFIVGTTTDSSREHAIERWHLPHYMKELDIRLHPEDDVMKVTVAEDDMKILDMTVTSHQFAPVRDLYNSFMVDGDNHYKVNIYMEGPHAEHEEERGSLTLYEHAMTEGLTRSDVSSYAFREQWLRGGMQTFEELERI
ncbi:MAG TPA: hypothetical protein DIU18_00990 [Gemmatimonadetes bacterium]|nr:hypothetical protein [Gemmatimonadota bacterium]|tara:strand:+ start:160 stop:822 length:663 start_codon:yes stop_codon:yes gene_type:complete